MPGKSSISAAHIAQIGDAAELGMKPDMAAQYAGISRRTLYHWLRRGENDPDSIFGAFRRAYKAGVSRCAVRALHAINEAAEAGHWRASAWLLERRFGYTIRNAERRAKEDAALSASPVTSAEEYRQMLLKAVAAGELARIALGGSMVISEEEDRPAQCKYCPMLSPMLP